MCFATIFAMGNRAKLDEAGRSIISVKGNIVVFGNEPHTWLGLKTEDDKVYNLVAEEKILTDLRKKQGLILEITGGYEPVEEGKKLNLTQFPDGTIYVHSVKVAK